MVSKNLRKRDLDGWCVYNRREIQIEETLTGAHREETFLHELLHACLPENWAPNAEETMIRRLAPRLLDTLKGLGWMP